jgi:hypothetical protein
LIAPGGTSYEANVQLEDTETFEFFSTGMLGERIPLKVENASLSGDCDPCTFEWNGDSIITFDKGDYTVHYRASLTENHLTYSFSEPRTVRVTLPPALSVKNPLLGMVSPGAAIISLDDGSTIVQWNETRSFELRFYDEGREELLLFFGNFWIILAIVLLIPFLMTWRRKEE